jgi:ABC-type Co2+ transport system permease subunit
VTGGDQELVQVIVSWAVTLPAVAVIIVRDERRLKGEALERCWPPQSRDAAIFGLYNLGVHPLCVLVHFARTRRGVQGILLGFAWLAAIVAVDVAAQEAALATIDWLRL